VEIFGNKKEIKHISRLVDIEEIQKNDYNLSVSAYIEPKDTKEKIDIKKLNTEIKKTVEKIDKLRSEIDKIVAEIEEG